MKPSALAAALLLAATPSTADQQAAGATPELTELRGATYRGIEGVEGPVTLVEGRWEGTPFVEGGASRPSVALAEGFRVTGDLDGDGADDAIVLLAYSGGGSGTFDYLAAARRGDGGAVEVVTAPLGDRVRIRAAKVEDGHLLVDVLQPGPEDARCCPGELLTRVWTLTPAGLVEGPPAGPATRLSLAAIEGSDWVLGAWSLGEPAATEPEITLRFEAGRFSGSAGYNRYFAGVTPKDGPGEIEVGPPGSTMMACPEPQEAGERRFLPRLQGARSFGFHLGQLSLDWQIGEETGTLLFVPKPSAGP